MKISVCGKGGSGKSVVTCLLASGIRDRVCRTVVVDSDESNTGLHRLLGFAEPPVPLLEVVGGKKQVFTVLAKNVDVRPAAETNVMLRDELRLADIPGGHVLHKDGISLLAVGKIVESHEGCACPMGVPSREFLGKLRLEQGEVAIVDMEAGVEHLGRGVDSAVDIALVIVEPSYESLEIAERVAAMNADAGPMATWAILNKVTSSEVASRLESELQKRRVSTIGRIYHDPEVFEACLDGRPVRSELNAGEVAAILDRLGIGADCS
jgi:CO dehydrogenase maturation factor